MYAGPDPSRGGTSAPTDPVVYRYMHIPRPSNGGHIVYDRRRSSHFSPFLDAPALSFTTIYSIPIPLYPHR